MSVIVEGGTYVITTTFRDTDGNLMDPATVDATVRAPDGTITNPVPVNVSVGIWTTSDSAIPDGWWFYEITGNTGEDDAVVSQGSFCVVPSLVSA